MKSPKYPYFRVSVFAYTAEDKEILKSLFRKLSKENLPCFIIAHKTTWAKNTSKTSLHTVHTLWRMAEENNINPSDRNIEPLPEKYEIVQLYKVNESDLR